MTNDANPLSSQRLAELIAATDGVAPSPWTLDESHALFPMDATGWVIGADRDTATQTGQYLLHCDPQTIRSLAQKLLAVADALYDFDIIADGVPEDEYGPAAPATKQEIDEALRIFVIGVRQTIGSPK